jgi:hypothetical protein
MRPETANSTFTAFLTQKGADLATLTPPTAIQSMIGFYRDIRAEDCDMSEDGDMLLFQWGTYDWGTGAHFSYNITRQFIVNTKPNRSQDVLFKRDFQGNKENDDAYNEDAYDADHMVIIQLSLTMKYPPLENLKAIKSGNRWCVDINELPDFMHFIGACEATQAVQARHDGVIELDMFRP